MSLAEFHEESRLTMSTSAWSPPVWLNVLIIPPSTNRAELTLLILLEITDLALSAVRNPCIIQQRERSLRDLEGYPYDSCLKA